MTDQQNPPTTEELLNKAWSSLSGKKTAQTMPADKSELKRFEHFVGMAEKNQSHSEQSKILLSESIKHLKQWKNRHFVGSFKLLIISIVATGWFGYQIYQRIQQGLPALDTESASEHPILYTILGILFVLGIIGYYWSQRAPAWLIIQNGMGKGHSILESWDKETHLSEQPVTYTEYYDKSGRKVGDDQAMAEGTNAMIAAIFWVIKHIIMYLLIPLISLIGFFRFYVFYM
ncbi:MAG: hypothetical protein JXR87_01305 [Candidatus Marinimicrobia bacterium]|nr:hypothetical protein [Candidatus Neomarinimicrobiota bacterium]